MASADSGLAMDVSKRLWEAIEDERLKPEASDTEAEKVFSICLWILSSCAIDLYLRDCIPQRLGVDGFEVSLVDHIARSSVPQNLQEKLGPAVELWAWSSGIRAMKAVNFSFGQAALATLSSSIINFSTVMTRL